MADVFDGTFIEVINANGDPQTIPAAWIGTPLGEGFEVAPPSLPSEEWTIQELREYARDNGIDLTGAGRTKADVAAAIVAAQITTTQNPISTDTPADRGEE